MMNFDGRGRPSVNRGGDDRIRDQQQQQQQQMQHGGAHPSVGGSQPPTFMRRNSKSSGDFGRDMMPHNSHNRNNNNQKHRNNNQGWAEEDISYNPYGPPTFSRRTTEDSGITQIRRNTKSYGDLRGNNNNVASAPLNDPNEGYDTDVSNNPRPRTADLGGRNGRLDVSNTSRIIAERKRRTTSSSG